MNASSEALRLAVHQNALGTTLGLQQRLFSFWFNSFIYNQIWEDPVVDMEALQLQADSRLLTIASGGCNVLNYLTAQPASITAIDLNPYHLALTRLKIAAMAQLPDYASFYDFFGYADRASNIDLYERHLAPHLEDDLAQFWGSSGIFGKARIQMFANGLYRQTRFGYFMRFLNYLGRRSGARPELLLQAQTLAEQRAIFEQHIEPFFTQPLIKALGKLPLSVFSLGIPPQQYAAMKAEGNLVEQYRGRVERLCCDLPIQDNYFAWQAFAHQYDHEQRLAIPLYLNESHYELIKNQMPKVQTVSGSIIDYLRQQPAESLDRFVFLDAQDWMSDEVLTSLWQEVLRVGKPRSRIIFRTAAAESPLEAALPTELLAKFSYHRAASQRLFALDRSAIYGGFHLYCKGG